MGTRTQREGRTQCTPTQNAWRRMQPGELALAYKMAGIRVGGEEDVTTRQVPCTLTQKAQHRTQPGELGLTDKAARIGAKRGGRTTHWIGRASDTIYLHIHFLNEYANVASPPKLEWVYWSLVSKGLGTTRVAYFKIAYFKLGSVYTALISKKSTLLLTSLTPQTTGVTRLGVRSPPA